MAIYEFEDWESMDAVRKSDIGKVLIAEYHAAFGEHPRKCLFGVEL
jgi:hypothetical protein